MNRFKSTKVESFTETKKPFPKEKWLFVEKVVAILIIRKETSRPSK